MPSQTTLLGLAADAVLAVHMAFAAFVVLSFPAVWIGAALSRSFARNRAFRLAHLAAVALVAAEAVLGVFCPLTEWEERLRGLAGQAGGYGGSFIRHFAERLFYFEAPLWVFTALYLVVLALAVATWRLVPPRPRRGRKAGGGD